jgi:hypothetical protein
MPASAISWVAYESQRALLRECDRVRHLRWRSTKHLRSGTRSHSRRGPRFRLTAAFGAGQRRALSNHGADQAGRRERVYQRVVGQTARRGETGEHSGKHARAAGGWRRNDDAHRRIHLLDRERPSENVAEWRAGERARRTIDELRRVTADQARRRSQIARETLAHGALHHKERALQYVADLADRSALVF